MAFGLGSKQEKTELKGKIRSNPKAVEPNLKKNIDQRKNCIQISRANEKVEKKTLRRPKMKNYFCREESSINLDSEYNFNNKQKAIEMFDMMK